MTETNAAEEAGGTRLGRAFGRMKPKRGAMHVFGVLLLVAAALGAVAAIAFGIIAARQNYFEQRNLRELDRIATELSATGEALAQTASLHFVPQQLHFQLSRQLECLSASTEVTSAGREPITITDYFTDPAGSEAVAAWYAGQTTNRRPDNSAEPPPVVARPLPPDLCGYVRPLVAPSNDRSTLDSGRFMIERSVRLTALLWPMTGPGIARRDQTAQPAARQRAPAAPRKS